MDRVRLPARECLTTSAGDFGWCAPLPVAHIDFPERAVSVDLLVTSPRDSLGSGVCPLKIRRDEGIKALLREPARKCLSLSFTKLAQWNVGLARVALLNIIRGSSMPDEKQPHAFNFLSRARDGETAALVLRMSFRLVPIRISATFSVYRAPASSCGMW